MLDLWKSITGNNELASLTWAEICAKIMNPNMSVPNEVAFARIVQTNIMDDLKTDSIQWPSLDVSLPFEEFQAQIKELFIDLARSFEEPDSGCPPKNQKPGCGKPEKDEKESKSSKKCINFQAITYSIMQQLSQHMFTPDSPTKGGYLWHSVGSGKTCNASAIGSLFQAKGWTVIWVTRTSLKSAIENSMFDRACHIGLQRAFKGTKDLSMCPQEERFELLQKLFAKEGGTFLSPVNYRIFCNAFVYPSNPLLVKLKAIQRKRGRSADSDLLFNTLIIIDETHLLMSALGEGKSGMDKLPQIERPSKQEIATAFKAIENSYAKSGKDSCKVLQMTGTPWQNDVTEYFRGVNLIQPNKTLHLPTTKRAFKDKYVSADGKLSPQFTIDYQNCARGLVSYFDLANDHKKVAQINHENEVRVKFNELVTCGYVGTGRVQRGAGGKKEGWAKCTPTDTRCIQRHYLFQRWNRNWNIFERNAPNFTKSESEIKTILDFIRANLETLAPKILALHSMVKKQDDEDMRTHGKLFKHMIFTGVDAFGIDRGIVPFIPTWMALGYNFIQEIKNAKWAIKDPLPEGTNNFAALYSRGMFTAGQKPLDMKCSEDGKASSKKKCVVTELLDTTCGLFNNHEKNSNGQLCRFILLDQGFSTGIDLYDIKHIHVLEQQATKATTTQVHGRATRYCGSVGLPQSEPDKSWDIDVTTYFGEFAEARCLKLKSKGPFEHVKALGGNIAQANIADEIVNIIIKSAVDRDLTALFQASPNKKPLVEKYVFDNMTLSKDKDSPQVQQEPEQKSQKVAPVQQIRERQKPAEEYLRDINSESDEFQPHVFVESVRQAGLDGNL